MLVSDAVMGPIRDAGMDILKMKDVPAVEFKHFEDSLNNIRVTFTLCVFFSNGQYLFFFVCVCVLAIFKQSRDGTICEME